MSIVTDILSLIPGLGSGNTSARKDTEVMSQPPDTLQASQGIYLYHRNIYRILLKVALLESLVALSLIGIALWVILAARPQDRFFVSSVDGRIDRVLPLDNPLMDNNETYSRVGTDITNAMTFGFLDFEQRKLMISAQFDPQTLQTLQSTLIGPGGLTQMGQEGRVYISEVNPARGGGIVRQQTNQDFIHEWIVSVPVDVVTKSGLQLEKQTRTPWTVTVLVQRSRRLEASHGYLIARLISAQPEGPAQPETPQPATEGTPP